MNSGYTHGNGYYTFCNHNGVYKFMSDKHLIFTFIYCIFTGTYLNLKVMKTLFLLVTLTLVSITILIAQVPQAFKYQAMARDEAGDILSNWNISLRVSIVQGGQDGQLIYSETHQVTSNIYGMINLVIGEGSVKRGEFESIKWGTSSHSIKMEMDTRGGTDYKEIGASQLYAVPYALYAENAGNLIGSEPKEPASTQKSTQNKANSSGGNRSGTPNTKFPASGDSYTNVDNGNLGVGTYEPTEKLEVIGNIKASGTISSDGPLIMYDHLGNPRELTINPDGTWDMKFLCEGIIRDVRDGREYKIVKIGDQCWMAENLNIGDKITGVTPQSDNGDIEKYCYDNSEANCDLYGGLYQWNEMMQYVIGWENRGVCPFSWHIPSGDEMDLLVNQLGGTGIAGGAMKDIGYDHWLSPNEGATNSSGFTAFGGGERIYSTGIFHYFNELGSFWSATDDGGTGAYRMMLGNLEDAIDLQNTDQDWGFSVRCLKDFECGDSIIDHRDGKKYGTVLIGKQCWMSQNLNFGSMILGVTPQTPGTDEKYCYDDFETKCDTFGGLYQWDEMMQYVTDEGTQGICPEGFHLPTGAEWKVLEGNVDSHYGLGVPEWDGTDWRGFDAGAHLKSAAGWESDLNGDDDFGFTALPGGCLEFLFTSFGWLGYYGQFWSSSESDALNAWGRYLKYSRDNVFRVENGKAYGFSVRCLQDRD